MVYLGSCGGKLGFLSSCDRDFSVPVLLIKELQIFI